MISFYVKVKGETRFGLLNKTHMISISNKFNESPFNALDQSNFFLTIVYNLKLKTVYVYIPFSIKKKGQLILKKGESNQENCEGGKARILIKRLKRLLLCH